MEDIAPEYKYVFNRLRKLEGSIKQIVRQNSELKEANNKLRLEHDTWQQRETARERILEQLTRGDNHVQLPPADVARLSATE